MLALRPMLLAFATRGLGVALGLGLAWQLALAVPAPRTSSGPILQLAASLVVAPVVLVIQP